jgi:hypothetical protein
METKCSFCEVETEILNVIYIYFMPRSDQRICGCFQVAQKVLTRILVLKLKA